MTFYEWLYSLDVNINWDSYDSLEELEEQIVNIVKKKNSISLRPIYDAFFCNSDSGITLSEDI